MLQSVSLVVRWVHITDWSIDWNGVHITDCSIYCAVYLCYRLFNGLCRAFVLRIVKWIVQGIRVRDCIYTGVSTVHWALHLSRLKSDRPLQYKRSRQYFIWNKKRYKFDITNFFQDDTLINVSNFSWSLTPPPRFLGNFFFIYRYSSFSKKMSTRAVVRLCKI